MITMPESQRYTQPSLHSTRGRNFIPPQPQPQPQPDVFMRKRGAGVAETAGQVTADVTAVCCCCSFGLINLFYFCFIKLPTGLLLRSARKFKRRARPCRKCSKGTSCSCSTKMRKSALLFSIEEEESDACLEGEDRNQAGGTSVFVFDLEPTKDDIEFEEEMWRNLMNSGFGRSLSRRYE